MNKAFVMATALMLLPLPAMSQESQGQRDRNQPSLSREPASSYQSQGGDQSGGGDRGTSQASNQDMDQDPLERLMNSQLPDRLAQAVQTVEAGCAEDISNFCGDVTPGAGRISLCVQAYEDQLSRSCRSALQRVATNIQKAVASVADPCLNSIRSQCGDSGNIGQCLQQKAQSLQPSCQALVTAVRGVSQAVASLRGMPVFSADDKNLGQIVEINRGPDGKVQSIQVQIGRFLGLGDKVVTIDADKFEQLADRIKLRMGGDDVRSLQGQDNRQVETKRSNPAQTRGAQ